MPMAQYKHIGDNGRISALIAVGTALGAPTNIIPSQTASQGSQHVWKHIYNLYAFKSLPLPLSIDYTAFTSYVNRLIALVP